MLQERSRKECFCEERGGRKSLQVGRGQERSEGSKIQEVLQGVRLILNGFFFVFVFFRNPSQSFIMLGCLDYASLETTPHRLAHEGGALAGIDQLC